MATAAVVEAKVQVECSDGLEPAAAVRVRLLDRRGQVLQQACASGEGIDRFEYGGEGVYRVHVVADTGQMRRTIAVDSGDSRVDVEATRVDSLPAVTRGEARALPGRVSLEGGDCAAAGVSIRLLDQRGQVVQAARADGDGSYTFSAVAPDSYTL